MLKKKETGNSVHMLKDILESGDWMTKVNLKDAYLIPIASLYGRAKPTGSTTFPLDCH